MYIHDTCLDHEWIRKNFEIWAFYPEPSGESFFNPPLNLKTFSDYRRHLLEL